MNKANIFVGAVNVWIAPSGSALTYFPYLEVTAENILWNLVGYMKAGVLKLAGESPELDLYDGQKFQTSSVLKWEFLGLESDEAKRTVIENLLNTQCDLVFTPIAFTSGDQVTAACRVFKISGSNISTSVEAGFAENDALSLKVMGRASGNNLSDIFSEITDLAFTEAP